MQKRPPKSARPPPVEMWTTLPCRPQSHSKQNQKKRTFDVLPKPDNLIRYRQMILLAVMAGLDPAIPAAASTTLAES